MVIGGHPEQRESRHVQPLLEHLRQLDRRQGLVEDEKGSEEETWLVSGRHQHTLARQDRSELGGSRLGCGAERIVSEGGLLA